MGVQINKDVRPSFPSWVIEIRDLSTSYFKRILFWHLNCTQNIRFFSQVLSRLFPFDDRGLCHAYWAPNFWALYNSADKAALVVGKRLHLISSNVTNTMTRGLVENSAHVVLPSVSPRVCLVLTLLGILVRPFSFVFDFFSIHGTLYPKNWWDPKAVIINMNLTP